MAYLDEVKKIFKNKLSDNGLSYKVTMFSDSCVIVEGSKRLIYFSEENIKFVVCGKVLNICGTALKIVKTNHNEHYISGKIVSIEVQK